MDPKIKIYTLSCAEWVATDRSKKDTADWWITSYEPGGDLDCIDPIEEWEEVDVETVHLRKVGNPNQGKCTMRETIERYLASGGILPFIVSTTEW